LREALAREKDAFARASLQAARSAVENRSVEWAARLELADELAKIRKAEVLEPTFVYQTHEHDRKREFLERVFKLEEVLAAPGGVMRNSRDFTADAQYPAAKTWTPPVRDYFDANRKSFGFCVTQDYGAFVGGVHIGDDVAWGKELRSVVAVAAGVVRRATHIFSWGFIVVIEHKQPDGQQLCSVYAHLSPLLHVKPGDVVAAGQKIGSTGRHYSVENGGYTAHTHFGLHRGPFSVEDGTWVHGYISQQEWKEGQHGWLDPQAFLKKLQ
jgi:murein DD-endopeptidase MepM/ murein hydrolase activator NlpD